MSENLSNIKAKKDRKMKKSYILSGHGRLQVSPFTFVFGSGVVRRPVLFPIPGAKISRLGEMVLRRMRPGCYSRAE